MTRLIIACRAFRGETEVPNRCSGADLYRAVEAVTGTGRLHALGFVSGEEIYDTQDEYELPDACVLVPLEKLILWVFAGPQDQCQVLHVWPGDMPDLLAEPSLFPNGAFWDNGERVDPNREWSKGISRLHTLPLQNRNESATEENWRGPRVCACNLLTAPVECPFAWAML